MGGDVGFRSAVPRRQKNARIRSTSANSIMGPRVRAPENRGGKCVEGRAAFLGPRWDRLAYRGEIRCREKIEKAWIGVAHPSQGGGNTSQGRQASPTCETPERLRSGSDHGFDRDVHGAHLLAGSRSNHQPLPSEAVALGYRTPNGAWSNEQPSEPARIVDVERQKYLTPNSSCLTAAYSPASRAPRRRSGPPGRSSPSWRKWR